MSRYVGIAVLVAAIALTIAMTPKTEVIEPQREETTIKVEKATESPTENPTLEYIGTFTITGYCPCERCCGQYALNRPLDENGREIVLTASGARAQDSHTIAAPQRFPFGTVLVINGERFTVEDRGHLGDWTLDRYYENHEACITYTADVYKEVENDPVFDRLHPRIRRLPGGHSGMDWRR